MKAAEVLRLYEAGRRDFRGEDLRGQRFHGKDLSGADFSQADICGTKFTNCTLVGTHFTRVRAGLLRPWAIAIALTSWLLAWVSGVSAALTGYFATPRFNSSDPVYQMAGWVAVVGVVLVYGLVLRKGLNAVTSGLTVALLLVWATVLSPGITVALAIALLLMLIMACATAAAGMAALVIAVAAALMGALTFSLVAIAAFAVEVPDPADVEIPAGVKAAIGAAFAFTLLVALLSAYIGWRAVRNSRRKDWIRSAAIAIAAVGGTSFRGADLTGADFTATRLKAADFRRAMLSGVCWQEARLSPEDSPFGT
ncbi:MAG: pentapeptide repeat-containing protein [Elainellaceae cyanobacterium]